jgi:hypothetical protein
MKVNKQPDGSREQFHITEELRLVDRENCLDSLQLNEKTFVDVKIHFKRLRELGAFVFDFDFHLAERRHLAQLELTAKVRAAASKSDKTNDFKIGWWN